MGLEVFEGLILHDFQFSLLFIGEVTAFADKTPTIDWGYFLRGTYCNHVISLNILYCLIGTGVVTSVPSDSPDDFAALRDLKSKEVI